MQEYSLSTEEKSFAVAKAQSEKKQRMLADRYHTCGCHANSIIFDWENTEVIHCDFEQPEMEAPAGRYLWVLSPCKSCGGKVMHGATMCDYRAVGKKKLMDEAVGKFAHWIGRNAGADDSHPMIANAKKRLAVIWDICQAKPSQLVWGRFGKDVGIRTGKARPCTMESCRGECVQVRWISGRPTWPCTRGLKVRKDGSEQIE